MNTLFKLINFKLKLILAIILVPVMIVIGMLRIALAAGLQPLRTWATKRIQKMSRDELINYELKLRETRKGKWTHKQVVKELDRRDRFAKPVLSGLDNAETVNIGLTS